MSNHELTADEMKLVEIYRELIEHTDMSSPAIVAECLAFTNTAGLTVEVSLHK